MTYEQWEECLNQTTEWMDKLSNALTGQPCMPLDDVSNQEFTRFYHPGPGKELAVKHLIIETDLPVVWSITAFDNQPEAIIALAGYIDDSEACFSQPVSCLQTAINDLIDWINQETC